MKKIYSLNMVSYLRSRGFKEISLNKDETNDKVYYTFEPSTEVLNAIAEYKNPNVTVVLHDFIANFKTIKTEIYEFSKRG